MKKLLPLLFALLLLCACAASAKKPDVPLSDILQEIVDSVNHMAVSPHEVLSGHVYRFRRETGMLELAG